MKSVIKQLSLVLLLMSIVDMTTPLHSQERLIHEQKEAVRIAEKFVTSRGYDRKLKSNEGSICWDQSADAVEQGKSHCSNSIQSKAVVALIKNENGKQFWSVQFLFRQQPAERRYDYGREVRISLDGRKIWIESKVIRVWKHLPPD